MGPGETHGYAGCGTCDFLADRDRGWCRGPYDPEGDTLAPYVWAHLLYLHGGSDRQRFLDLRPDRGLLTIPRGSISK